jgi:succinate dehydrogenase / fumarate reductase cytochrome b subunit
VASSASRPADAGEVTSPRIPAGVPALRAGEGQSFFWRRLHSFSGIFPIGAFLVEHYLSNAFATNGGTAYNENVRFLTGLPFVLWLEITFIYIPLAFHAGYGFWIWWRGESNVGPAYPWVGNWMYTLQRYTGIAAFFYMGYHTWTMRFSGAHIITHSEIAFAKVWSELQNPWIVAFYFVGLIAASWHFAYGIWLFAAKWGIIVGEGARKRFGVLCLVIGLAMTAIASGSVYAFITTPQKDVPQLQEFRQLQQSR